MGREDTLTEAFWGGGVVSNFHSRLIWEAVKLEWIHFHHHFLESSSQGDNNFFSNDSFHFLFLNFPG